MHRAGSWLRSRKREAGQTVKEISREPGISEATFCNRKAKHGGMEISEVKRLKEPEAELARYKKMYAELSFDHQTLKNVVAKNGRPGWPQRSCQPPCHRRRLQRQSRSCAMAAISRSTYRYKHKQKDDRKVEDHLSILTAKHPAIGLLVVLLVVPAAPKSVLVAGLP